MNASGRTLLSVCIATGAWSFGFGLSTQVISHWLKTCGLSDTDIGLNHSIYYLGLAVASLAVPWLTRRLGTHCAAIGMVLSGVSLAIFPWGGGPAGWFVLRFLNGVAGAMSLVPLETFVSRESSPQDRARHFSYYAVALTLGGAAGIWAGLHFYRPEENFAFFLGAFFPLAGGLLLFGTLPHNPEPLEASSAEALDLSRHFLSYGTAWFQGFLEGGLLAFLSFYLISLNMSPDSAGMLMGVTMVGVILFQVPVAWLSDRLGRMPVLLGCYAMTMAGLALMPMWPPSLWLVVCLFALGACSGALYPLALALLGDQLAKTSLARAYAWFLAMECVGSQMGAAIMGGARDLWGEASMFYVGLAALGLVLGVWALLRVRQTCTAGAEAPTLGSAPALSPHPSDTMRSRAG